MRKPIARLSLTARRQRSPLLTGGPALGAAVKSVKDQLRAVPRNGLSYGALRYLSATPRPDLVVTPQILFNYLGRFTAATVRARFHDLILVRSERRRPRPGSVRSRRLARRLCVNTRLRLSFALAFFMALGAIPAAQAAE